jgi:hypothetical protein
MVDAVHLMYTSGNCEPEQEVCELFFLFAFHPSSVAGSSEHLVTTTTAG